MTELQELKLELVKITAFIAGLKVYYTIDDGPFELGINKEEQKEIDRMEALLKKVKNKIKSIEKKKNENKEIKEAAKNGDDFKVELFGATIYEGKFDYKGKFLSGKLITKITVDKNGGVGTIDVPNVYNAITGKKIESKGDIGDLSKVNKALKALPIPFVRPYFKSYYKAGLQFPANLKLKLPVKGNPSLSGSLKADLKASGTLELGIQDRLGLLKLGLTITLDLKSFAELSSKIAKEGGISFDNKITFEIDLKVLLGLIIGPGDNSGAVLDWLPWVSAETFTYRQNITDFPIGKATFIYDLSDKSFSIGSFPDFGISDGGAKGVYQKVAGYKEGVDKLKAAGYKKGEIKTQAEFEKAIVKIDKAEEDKKKGEGEKGDKKKGEGEKGDKKKGEGEKGDKKKGEGEKGDKTPHPEYTCEGPDCVVVKETEETDIKKKGTMQTIFAFEPRVLQPWLDSGKNETVLPVLIHISHEKAPILKAYARVRKPVLKNGTLTFDYTLDKDVKTKDGNWTVNFPQGEWFSFKLENYSK